MGRARDGDFETWLMWLLYVTDPHARFDRPGHHMDALSPVTRRWMREVYDAEGPLRLDVAMDRVLTHRERNAEAGAVLVEHDLRRAIGAPLTVRIGKAGTCAFYAGGDVTTTDGLECESLDDLCEAIIAVADSVQADTVEDFGVWPVCAQHGIGGRSRSVDGVAVWWCAVGRHSIARIGEL